MVEKGRGRQAAPPATAPFSGRRRCYCQVEISAGLSGVFLDSVSPNTEGEAVDIPKARTNGHFSHIRLALSSYSLQRKLGQFSGAI